MLKVCLGVPFRSDNPSRQAAHIQAWVAREYLYPWAEVGVFAGDIAAKGFNRAAVRNEIVQRYSDADIIVICDSDSVPEAEPLAQAIQEAYEDSLLHFPFNIVSILSPEGDIAYTYGPSAGGCYVFRPEVWTKVGGMDSRMGSWGADDRSFLVCVQTLIGRVIHHTGNLTCYWHERDDQTVHDPEAQRILYDEYFPLLGKPEALRAYLEEAR